MTGRSWKNLVSPIHELGKNKPMKKGFFAFGAATILGFASCEKVVVETDPALPEGSAKLTVITRSEEEDSDGESVAQARIYIFQETNKCVQILTPNEDNNTTTTQLSPGTYTIYALGGNDLERFTLPTLSEAMPTSVITLKDGKVMDSFLQQQVSVTLGNGDNQMQSIALDRKVFCLNKIEIKNVPTDVTAVGFMMLPLYSAIQLNGTYPNSPTRNYEVALNKQSDGTTWQATPSQLLFPSKNEPTITITFTTGEHTENYAYTMSEALEANHYYTISGTYQSSKLSFTLTATDWEEERDIDFDFNDDSRIAPVAGEFYKGYYVISVDEQSRKAVLLSEKVSYEFPEDEHNIPLWRAELEARMKVLSKPANTTNEWRFPTLTEAEIFTKDPNAVTFTSEGISPVCFCVDDKDTLGWAYTKKNEDGTFKFIKSFDMDTYNFNTGVRLRPVIDITY